ncbi:MAG: peptidylprolyl isomerase [Sandaracinaceae bacterium]|nr:peptidylprolyl isomerase [Sandaracinaceae bacterium]
MRLLRFPILVCLIPLLALGACRSGSRDGERAEIVRPSAAPAAAPGVFTVLLDTTKGPIHIDVHPEWAPLGAARFRELVEAGYYTDIAFFRVIEGFMAQIGIHGDPAVNARWRENSIQDDPVTQSNTRGMLSFATRGPNTRTTQFFISFGDNSNLDGMGFSPFAQVRAADMAVVDSLYNGYGEGAPRGRGPDQGRMHEEGNTYLRANYPELDYVRSARIVPN